jgi:E3 ubiquitin-protein ligase MARCH6
MSDGGWWNISSTSQVTRSTASSEQVPSETSTPSGNGILGFLSSPSPAPLASATNGVSEVNHTAVETNKSNTNSFYIDGIFFDHNPFGNATRFRFVNRLLVDVMEGQLLTALIVVSFVIIFLIREWVVQQQPALEGDVLVDQAVGVAERLDLADLAVEVAVAPENPEPNRRWGNANGAAAEAGEDSASGLDGPMPVHIGQTPAETDDENDDRPGLMEIGSDSPQQHRRFARPRTRRRLPAQEPASDGALAQGQRPEADDIDERNYSWSESSTSMPFPQRPTSTRENTAQVANLRRDLEEITRYAGTPGYGFGGDGGTFQFTWDSSGSSSQSDMRSRQHPNSTISDGSEANPSEWPKDNISLSRPISFAAAEHTASDTGRRPSRNYNEGDANGSGITTWEPSSLADIDSSYGPGKTFDQSPFTYDGTESEGKGKGKERPHFDDNIESVLESEGEDESIPGGSRGIGASEWSTIASPPTPPPLNQAVAQVDGGARGNENELQEHRLPRHNVLLNTALRHAANHETEGALARPIFDHDIPPQQNLDELNQRNIDVGDVDEDVEGPVAGVPPVMVDDDGADDFEGIMELVGMRGPLLGLVQNAAISNMLITATVATGVAFPYVTGKTVMMILAHPILFCFKIPSMAVSFCAEFLVDSATVFVFSVLLMFDQLIRFFARPASYFLPILGRYLSSSSITNFLRNWASDGQTRVFAKFTTIETAYMAIRRLPPSAVPPLSIVVKESWERFSISICWVLEKMGLAGLTSASISAGPHELDLKLFKMSNPLSIVAQVWEDTFAAVNHTWTTNSTTGPGEAVLLNSLHLAPYGAYPWSAWDRVGVVLLGYAFFTVAGMIYVNRRRRGQVGNIERTATEFLQQCGGVMKVVLIIGIEMFVFPLYCGILLGKLNHTSDNT